METCASFAFLYKQKSLFDYCKHLKQFLVWTKIYSQTVLQAVIVGKYVYVFKMQRNVV